MTITETEPPCISILMLKSCLLKAQKPRVRTRELKGNVYFTFLEKTAVAVAASFQRVQSFWLVSLSYLRIEKDVLSKERTIVFMAIYGFSFESNLKKCCTELYSAVCSCLATCSSFLCSFLPTKTTWCLVKTINWEVLYLLPFHGEIVFKEEIQRAAETWVTLLRLRIWLP